MKVKAKKMLKSIVTVGLMATLGLSSAFMVSCMGGGEKVENKIVFGNVTAPQGEFRFGAAYTGSSIGASDQDIQKLTTGYSTMEIDRAGSYQWNETVVKSHSEVETEDGTLVITIELNEGLQMSDGSEVTADNYLVFLTAFATPVAEASGTASKIGQTYVGYKEFNVFNGDNIGETVDGVVASDKFTGIKKLGSHKFSLEVSTDFFPYYFAYTYGAVDPFHMELVLGKSGVTLIADETGCKLSESFYEGEKVIVTDDDGVQSESKKYTHVDHLKEARFDLKSYPYSGPYVIEKWDEQAKECTMKLNENFAGNFEGQKPSVETVVYREIVSATQTAQFTSGELDILEAISGGTEINEILSAIENSGGKFDETHYDRAGYGKLQFVSDFGPTMFQEVRQAVAYSLDRNDFSSSFTGGYGSLVHAPLAVQYDAYTNNKDTLDAELNTYAVSKTNAEKVLVDNGWVFNSQGQPFVKDQSGVESVRYKKLTAEEATEVNKEYASAGSIDGVAFKTTKVGDDYYMPLVINWSSSENNPVSDLLVSKLQNSTVLTSIGMKIQQVVMTFSDLLAQIYRSGGSYTKPTYGMFNLATGFTSEIYDYSYNWSLDPDYADYNSNKMFDKYDIAFPYDGENKLSFEDAMEQSEGKLGMDYLSMAMVYSATTKAEYEKWFVQYMIRWNELLPDIPLYSNIYYDAYHSKIQGFETSPFFGAAEAIVYCNIKGAE